MPLQMGTQIPVPGNPTIPIPTGPSGQPIVWQPGRAGVAAMTWTTWDGIEWDIMSGADRVMLCEGMLGIGGMTQTEYVSPYSEVDGQFYRAGWFGPRPVFWPTLVWADTDPAGDFTSWLERWNNGLSYNRAGTWMVRDARGTERRLHCRLQDPGDDQNHDPTQLGWAALGTKLIADQPHWEGKPVERKFAAATGGIEMFTPEPGRIIRITSGSTFATADINNPGQVEAWPVWTIYGPCENATIGVGNNVVTVPFSLSAGQAFRLDTRNGQFLSLLGTGDPTSGSFDNGVDVVQRLSSWDIAPVLPGRSMPLNVSMGGTDGILTCSLTPLYYRGVA